MFPALASLGLSFEGARATSSAGATVGMDNSGWVVNQRAGLAAVNPVLAGAVVLAALAALLLWRRR